MTCFVRRFRGASLFLVLLMAACSSDPHARQGISPSSTIAAPSASGPTPSLTDALGQGEDEQAAAVAAIAAYNGSWALVVQARRDPGAKPSWKLDYRQYFTDPALSVALGLVYGMRDAGLASPTGEPARDPTVVAADGQARTAEISDCVDFRPWPEIFVSTGQQNSIPAPPFVIEARVIYDAGAGRWLVTEQTPHPDQPC